MHRVDDRRASRRSPRTAIAQPTGTSYTDTGLAAGTYYYKVIAEDAAGNVSPASNEASATVTGDVVAPSGAWLADRDRRRRTGRAVVAGGDRQRRRRAVQRPPLDDVRLHAGRREPDRAADRDELHRHGTRGRHLLLQGHRRRRRGQRGAASNQASATVTTAPPAGSSRRTASTRARDVLTDLSGTGNNGAINGADVDGAGNYGGALTFDGVNDIVNVSDANSLDLTTAMTLEAWIRPTALGTNWRTDLSRSRPATTSTASTATPARADRARRDHRAEST